MQLTSSERSPKIMKRKDDRRMKTVNHHKDKFGQFGKFIGKAWQTGAQEVIIRRCSVKRKDVIKIFAKLVEKHLCRILFFNKIAGCKPKTVRSSHLRCSVKQRVLKNFTIFTGKNLCWSLFLIKLQFWGHATSLKKTLTQVSSSEIC